MRKPVPLPPGYTVREFRPTDAFAYPEYVMGLKSLHADPDEYLDRLAENPGYTIFRDGLPVASGGCVLLHRGNASAWFLPTDDVRQHPKFHIAMVRQFLEMMEEEYAIWRIEATCDIQDERARNWLKHLGFEVAGVKRSYLGTGMDHLEFERLRSEP